MSGFMLSAAPILWLILVIVLIVLEVATYQLVAIWFALGAAASLIASLFHLSGTLQILIFIAVSALSLMASRPLVKKLQSVPKEKTNADRVIGQTGRVIHPITAEQKGRVEIDGLDWSAAAQTQGEEFQVGQEVTVVRIEGVTVFVQKKS